jgi:2-dehydro-3-deoxygluconokinase
VDIVATNRSVSEQVFGFSGTDQELMAQYRDTFGCPIVCLTSREIPSMLHNAWSSQALYEGEVVHGQRLEFDIVDRFGTGDAWFAGFLYGYLERGVPYGLDFGNALCALAHTTEGDVVQSSPSEVEALLQGSDLRLRR